MIQDIIDVFFIHNTLFAIITLSIVIISSYGVFYTIKHDSYDDTENTIVGMWSFITILGMLIMIGVVIYMDIQGIIDPLYNPPIGDTRTFTCDTFDLINVKEVSDDLWNIKGNIMGNANGFGIFLLGVGGAGGSGSQVGTIHGSNKIEDYYVFYTISKDSCVIRNKLPIKNTTIKCKNQEHFYVQEITTYRTAVPTDRQVLYRDKNKRIQKTKINQSNTSSFIKNTIYIDMSYIKYL